MADEAKARGNAAFSTRNFTQAITHFTEAINISPNNHILYSNRSAAYASLSYFTQALTDAKKTVQLKPDCSKGYPPLGAAFTGLKKYTEAVSSYQKGLQIDPDNAFLKSCLSNATSLSHKRLELKEAFQSAKKSDKMFKLFKKMESCFHDSELGMECWAVARQLLSNGGTQEKVLFYGKRALKALLDDDKKDYYAELPCFRNKFSNISIVDIVNDNINHHGSSLFVASVCAILGAACLDLGRLDESFNYLDRANVILTKLEAEEGDKRCGGNCVLNVLDLTLIELCKVKQLMGRVAESIPHARKVVEIRELVMEDDCFELGQSYRDVCAVYMAVMDTYQARPFCLKALEIYTKHVGPETVEVAGLRRYLAFIYNDSQESEKAIEQNRLALGILKKLTPDSLAIEIEKKVFEGLKGLPLSELGFMHEVNKHLSKMKQTVTESPTTTSSQSKDGGLSEKISKCDISDDGKATTCLE